MLLRCWLHDSYILSFQSIRINQYILPALLQHWYLDNHIAAIWETKITWWKRSMLNMQNTEKRVNLITIRFNTYLTIQFNQIHVHVCICTKRPPCIYTHIHTCIHKDKSFIRTDICTHTRQVFWYFVGICNHVFMCASKCRYILLGFVTKRGYTFILNEFY